MSTRADSSGEVQARSFRARGSRAITAAAAAAGAAATWLAYFQLLETTMNDICATFEANPLSTRAARTGEVQARSFRARGSRAITAAAAATWLAYFQQLETTMNDICAKFEANPLSTRAASSGAVEAPASERRCSRGLNVRRLRTCAQSSRRARADFLSQILRRRFFCAYCARALRACANSCLARQKISPMRAARVRAARVRALVSPCSSTHCIQTFPTQK